MTGALYSVKVLIDGVYVGEIKNGAGLSVEVPPGTHSIHMNGGGLKKDATFEIKEGATTKLTCYFSNLGILGGGLNIKPA